MSHWCPTHIQYEAQTSPETACPRCWELYYLKCPEDKGAAFRRLDDYDWETT